MINNRDIVFKNGWNIVLNEVVFNFLHCYILLVFIPLEIRHVEIHATSLFSRKNHHQQQPTSSD